MKDSDQDAYCIDDPDGTPSISFGFAQTFSDKTTTSLKPSTLLPYLLHINLLNCSVTYERWSIKNGLCLIGFLPAQFEAIVEGGAKAYFEKTSAHYWFISSY